VDIVAEHAQEPYQTPESHDDLVIYASKGKVLTWTLLAFTFTVIAVLAAVFRPSTLRNDPCGNGLMLILTLVLFGGGTVRGLLRLFSSAPLLVVNHEGIWVNSRLVGAGTVAWSDIEALTTYRTPVQAILEIVLSNPRPILARQTALQRVLCLMLQHKLMTSGILVVSDSMLPISIAELLARIRAHYLHEIARHGIQVREGAR
jgi:hypothetical protein